MAGRSPRGHCVPFFVALLACAALPARAAGPAPARAVASKDLHAWDAGDDPAALAAWVHQHLRRADADIARLLAAKGARTVAIPFVRMMMRRMSSSSRSHSRA